METLRKTGQQRFDRLGHSLNRLRYNWLLTFLQLALLGVLISLIPARASRMPPVWGTKPVLGYMLLTASIADQLEAECGLADEQFRAVERIARLEAGSLRSLERESLVIINNPALALDQKRAEIAGMGYNRRVMGIVDFSSQRLERALDDEAFSSLVHWIEERWAIDRNLHGYPSRLPGARTYEVYATRYDSKGAYYVALPDKCLKFTNGGNHICDGDGYVVGKSYDVYVSYKKGVAARVGESGPWNIDDNYWATLGDPTPRRMFADLPLGMPEAQAAFFNGYNGGLDQYGRKVTAPFGIDLARQVSIDIGLQPGVNDWVQVTFMWTSEWGSGSAGGTDSSGGTGPGEAIQGVQIATPHPDGSVSHEVQSGQTLWEIAIAYGVTLNEILQLNGITKDAVILPSDELLVRAADSTPEATQSDLALAATSREVSTHTPGPTRTTAIRTATATQLITVNTPTGDQDHLTTTTSVNPRVNVDLILIGIVVVIGVGVFLLLLGSVLKKNG